jgi:hypothetical protein
MQCLPEILALIQCTSSAFATHHTILAAPKMGIDLVEPLPTTQDNYTYVVVAVEHFTK